MLDAAGNLVERRDQKGALVLTTYDGQGRFGEMWARDAAGERVTLRERRLHGDDPASGLTAAQARAANVLGKPARHYDEAGVVIHERNDFKGNALERVRLVIADAVIARVFEQAGPGWNVVAFRVDWQPPAGVEFEAHAMSLLDAAERRTSAAYDACDRPTRMVTAVGVDGTRRTVGFGHNRAGLLESIQVDGAVFVERIAYDAKGQRTLLARGNGTMTRFAHDPSTLRLRRQRTERYTSDSGGPTYRPGGSVVQDLVFEYDLAGNIVAERDRAPGSGAMGAPLGADALDRRFEYDPLYRLLAATGREAAVPATAPPWDDTPRPQDPTRTRAYRQEYAYDAAGNLTVLRHRSADLELARDYALAPRSNRLASMTIGATRFDYSYDSSGNLAAETTSRRFEWDHRQRMRIFQTKTGDAEPSIHVHYLYDSAGERIKKLVRKQGGRIETTLYGDGLMERQRIVQGNDVHENDTLHLMDHGERIGTVRLGAAFDGDGTPAVKYFVADQLGSANVTLDGQGAVVDREEYTPHGETSFGSFARKRYRFTGKERDDESGLGHHEHRLYAPWLGRWTSCDPQLLADGTNAYAYVRNNPVAYTDPHGMSAWSWFKRNVVSRVVGAGKAAIGLAGMAAGAALCDTGIGCAIGGPLAVASADYGGSGLGQMVYGEPQPTLIGHLAGQRAQRVQEMLVEAAAFVGPLIRPLARLMVPRPAPKGLPLEPPGSSLAKGPFETAKEGGKHSGFLKNYQSRPTAEVQKAIRSIEEQIAEHRAKIANPESAIPDWSKLDPRQRQALITEKWPSDIQRQSEQVEILKGLLETRK